MRRRGRRSPWLLVPVVLLLGALALAAATLLRRGDRGASWPAPGGSGDSWGPGPPDPQGPGASWGPAPPEPAAQEVLASPATGESVEILMLLTRQELYVRAQQRGIRGRSGMSKRQLAEALAELD